MKETVPLRKASTRKPPEIINNFSPPNVNKGRDSNNFRFEITPKRVRANSKYQQNGNKNKNIFNLYGKGINYLESI